MRIGDERESENVEDMRGAGGGFPIGGGLGIGGILLALAASYFFGIDPSFVMNMLEGRPTTQAPVQTQPALHPRDEKAVFVAKVLASTEDTWTAVFRESGQRYAPPKLVLFTGHVPTACGLGPAAHAP